MQSNSTNFEFHEEFLNFILDSVPSGRFSSFCFDSISEWRRACNEKLVQNTVFHHLVPILSEFIVPEYQPLHRMLDINRVHGTMWNSFLLRFNFVVFKGQVFLYFLKLV